MLFSDVAVPNFWDRLGTAGLLLVALLTLLLVAAAVVLSGRWASHPRRSRRSPVPRPIAAAASNVTRRTVILLAISGGASAGLLAAAPAAADVIHRRIVPASAPRVQVQVPLADGAAALPATSGAGPNVVLITVDTLRADQLGCYGHPFVKTPALDALASQGARFGWHMVQEPQTDPSHGSIFTGMYPSSSGIRIHMVDKLPDTLDTLAAVFQKAGYATAGLFSFMALDAQYCNFQRGFQVYQDLTASGPGAPAATPSPAPTPLASAATPSDTPASGEPDDVPFVKGHADQTTDAAIAQIAAFGNRPFFLWLHYFDPHVPYQPPDAYANLYDPDYHGTIDGSLDTLNAILSGQLVPAGADLRRLISLYQGAITFLDSQLARLFAALDQRGLTQNTVVALTGDHGESFVEHTDFILSGDIFHPCSLYNPEGQVPLLIRYPPRIRPGSVVTAPTQAIDLFPTLLELAGLSIPDQAQGRTLLSLLDGSDDGSSRLAFASMPDYVFTSITTPGWKLIQNNATGQRHLYNLNRDPGELTDVLTASADTADQLTARLQAWMKAVKISS